MKHIWLIALACAVCMGAVGELKVEPMSRYNSAVTAANRLGEVILPVRYLLIDRQASGGGTHTYGLFLIMDSSTGRFQWVLREPPSSMPAGLIRRAFDGRAAVAYSSSSAVVVADITFGRIDILDAPNEARDMDDAESKAIQAAAQAPSGELGGMSPRWRTVSLAGLEDGFWAPPGHANFGPLKILAISQQDGVWKIVIEGQWKEMITLSDRYELLRAQRLE